MCASLNRPCKGRHAKTPLHDEMTSDVHYEFNIINNALNLNHSEIVRDTILQSITD